MEVSGVFSSWLTAETKSCCCCTSDINTIKAEPVEQYESRDTTQFTVMDAHGNAVSNTYTLGYSFGSGYVAEGTGILFDNQMLAQVIYAGYDIGEITCPTRYEEDSSSIGFIASSRYGLGVIFTSLAFFLHKLGLRKSKLFSALD